jgi:hypothetical protein
MQTTPKPIRPPTARSLALKQKAVEAKKRKLHVIATRRAKAAKMSKQDYIAAIVAGKYSGITPQDIAAEPDPGVEESPSEVAVSAEVPSSRDQ